MPLVMQRPKEVVIYMQHAHVLQEGKQRSFFDSGKFITVHLHNVCVFLFLFAVVVLLANHAGFEH